MSTKEKADAAGVGTAGKDDSRGSIAPTDQAVKGNLSTYALIRALRGIEIPDRVRRSPGGRRLRSVILHLLTYRNGKTGLAWPSVSTIAHEMCLDRKTVRASIRLGVELGILADSGPAPRNTRTYAFPGLEHPAPNLGVDSPDEGSPPGEPAPRSEGRPGDSTERPGDSTPRPGETAPINSKEQEEENRKGGEELDPSPLSAELSHERIRTGGTGPEPAHRPVPSAGLSVPLNGNEGWAIEQAQALVADGTLVSAPEGAIEAVRYFVKLLTSGCTRPEITRALAQARPSLTCAWPSRLRTELDKALPSDLERARRKGPPPRAVDADADDDDEHATPPVPAPPREPPPPDTAEDVKRRRAMTDALHENFTPGTPESDHYIEQVMEGKIALRERKRDGPAAPSTRTPEKQAERDVLFDTPEPEPPPKLSLERILDGLDRLKPVTNPTINPRGKAWSYRRLRDTFGQIEPEEWEQAIRQLESGPTFLARFLQREIGKAVGRVRASRRAA